MFSYPSMVGTVGSNKEGKFIFVDPDINFK